MTRPSLYYEDSYISAAREADLVSLNDNPELRIRTHQEFTHLVNATSRVIFDGMPEEPPEEYLWLVDQGEPNMLESSMAKSFAPDVAMQVTTDAVQIFGGYGYTQDYPVEKFMRDAKIMQIFEGTTQIQKLVISRSLIGFG